MSSLLKTNVLLVATFLGSLLLIGVVALEVVLQFESAFGVDLHVLLFLLDLPDLCDALDISLANVEVFLLLVLVLETSLGTSLEILLGLRRGGA